MPVLPLALKIVVGVALAVPMAWAFFGRPARRRPRRLVGLLGGAGAMAYTAGVAGVYLDLSGAGAVIGFSLVALCLAVWLGRAPAPDDDDGGGGGGEDDGGDDPGPDGPSPMDWEELDRARDRWAHPRAGSPKRENP